MAAITDKYISITDAAREKRVTIESIRQAITRGELTVAETFAGRRMLLRTDVDAYQPNSHPNRKNPESE